MNTPTMVWHTEQRRISELHPSRNNPRKLTDKQRRDLTNSLEKFDLCEIPAINADGQILAGHQRLNILERAGRGQELIDVRVPNRLLTQQECDEYCIRSNKNVGEWDWPVLTKNFVMADLQAWGFEDAELLPAKEEPVEVPEEPPADVLSFLVTAEQRKIIEDCLILQSGANNTERLVSLCRRT